MKILILSNMYPNNKFSKGIFIHQQAKELVRQGHEVRVISPVPWIPGFLKHLNTTWKHYSEISHHAVLEGIPVQYVRNIVFPGHLLYTLRCDLYPYAIAKYAEQLYQEFPFDIIHAHAVLPNGVGGIYLKKKYNKKLVMTIHGADLQFFSKKTAWRNYLLKTLHGADAITTVSHKLKKELLEIYPPPHENIIHVVNNGFDSSTIQGINGQAIRKHYQDKIILLSVGYLIKTKGHDYVLRVLSQLIQQFNNLIYLIVGNGAEEDNLKQLTRELGLEKHVVFLGYRPNQQALEYMSACDLFVLPSYEEGFGLVYLEAMALGKPVIGCKTQGIEDVITHGHNGFLVQPKSIEDLLTCIQTFLTNPDSGKKMGQLAQTTVLQNYSLETCLKNYITVYQNLIQADC